MVLNIYRYLSDLFYSIPERITLETKVQPTHQIVMLVSSMTWDEAGTPMVTYHHTVSRGGCNVLYHPQLAQKDSVLGNDSDGEYEPQFPSRGALRGSHIA